MKLNRKKSRTRVPARTHEGAPACTVSAEKELRRSVMACMLWEGQFYEDGESISDRIASLVERVKPEKVAEIAIEARTSGNLRHVPLLLVREMARRGGSIVSETLAEVIQRPDELSEFVSIYWKDGKQPLSAQVKKGLAKAFTKFSEYSLAKYDRDVDIRLRDVLYLCHAKPLDGREGYDKKARQRRPLKRLREQEQLFLRLVEGNLRAPDTWEVNLSAGEDKRETFERLITEEKLGTLALIKNLRNMQEAGVDEDLIREALVTANTKRTLPFRFVTAAKYAPRFESELEQAMFRCLEKYTKLPGKTILIVDVSGSMYQGGVSGKSEVDRAEVACSLAVLIREVCEDARIYATAGDDFAEVHKTEFVPARRGFALSDGIYKMCHPLGGGGIFLHQVLKYVEKKEGGTDRIVVITDEQDCDHNPARSPKNTVPFGDTNYLINVASFKNGIGYGNWTHIDGWSDAVIEYIAAVEGHVRQTKPKRKVAIRKKAAKSKTATARGANAAGKKIVAKRKTATKRISKTKK